LEGRNLELVLEIFPEGAHLNSSGRENGINVNPDGREKESAFELLRQGWRPYLKLGDT
jgi:hypothetical protein